VVVWLAASAWLTMMSFFVVGAVLIVQRLFPASIHRLDRILLTRKQPPVSILRPLKGVDFGMEDNLRAAYTQLYPTIEMVLCVATHNDPAIPMARQIMDEFPDIPSKLLVGDMCVGMNPKINNLHRAMTDKKEGATHDFVWILDSNCRPARCSLARAMTLHLDTDASVTHNAPFPLYPRSFGARLEQLFLSTVHTRMYSVINWTTLASCLNGKSNLYRRSDLARATSNGSLALFGAHLAEDNLIGEAMRQHVGLHQLAPDPSWQPLGDMSVAAYFSRRIRWTRIRKHNVTAATLLEPFTECFVVGMYGVWALTRLSPRYFPPEYGWLFYAMHVALWFLCDLLVFRIMTRVAKQTGIIATPPDTDQSVWGSRGQWVLAWLVRELSALPVWIWAVLGMTVEWRGQLYQLHMDGRASVIGPSE